MYDQIREDISFILLYGGVTAIALMLSCYLLFRRANAIAPDVTPPVRLRRWTAAFFASIALSHAWYMPTAFLSSSDSVKLNYLIGGLLDSLTFVPLAIIVMLTMLQDRRRPLWPVAVMVAPIVVIMTLCVVYCSNTFYPTLYAYFLLFSIGLIAYMVHAVRQYSRWLRDNYADLEHKEVWQSFVVLAVILLIFGIYALGIDGMVYQYVVQINDIVLVCYLLWRVETLSSLTPVHSSAERMATANSSFLTIHSSLQKYCIDTGLYLQHDLTLMQLAKAVGTNRFYLSQYFSRQGMTYNAYINDLRINHFISLYREAVATQRPFTALQLAQESGFRSYRTFSDAFKRNTGQSVTAWIKAHPKAKAHHEGQEKS